ncbi:MAG: PAS domain-containing protein [Candidatus Brockarchaeota archaeon]|nr:PAS domain-containing protein [Candidatus Brockarchaeota archaeon]MBO3842896.1 PAS domain-containing protein [Candidatus Brockarchaeota archaeon]
MTEGVALPSQKSIYMVNGILKAFKKGEKDVAEFWVKAGDRLINIRYFAVRDKDGKYI